MVFAGMILAKAAALYEKREGRGLFVNQNQSFAPSLGGDIIACDVVISQNSAFYPFVQEPDYLVAMSQLAIDKFADQTGKGTVFFLDADEVGPMADRTIYLIPALRRARELGGVGSANMIMLGALIAITRLLAEESVLLAIDNASPSSKVVLNKRAFSEGMNIGRTIIESKTVE